MKDREESKNSIVEADATDAARGSATNGTKQPGRRAELTFLRHDREGQLHRVHLGGTALLVGACAILLLFVLVVTIYEQRLRAEARQRMEVTGLTESLRTGLYAVTDENTAMRAQIEEQQHTIDALGASLTSANEEIEAQRAAAEDAAVPREYPMRGSASMMQDEGSQAVGEVQGAGGGHEDVQVVTGADDEENETGVEATDGAGSAGTPGVRFLAGEGSRMVAAADGVVLSVESDETYGMVIEVDHGYGYHSIYAGGGTVFVSEGDRVVRGEALIYFTEELTPAVYRITEDGGDIDPMQVMEISG